MESGTQGEFISIKGMGNKDIILYCWDKVENPRAIVQLFHGMAEHAGRYKRFADYLNKSGIAFYANDHRGHGKTAQETGELGYIGRDGFNKIVEDEHMVTCFIKNQHPNVPVILYCHSFGSFVGQEYITRYGDDINGIVLSGSAKRSDIEIWAGVILASLEKVLLGERKKCFLIEKLVFAKYNSRVEKPQSRFEWISRDSEEVKKYEEDELCGTAFTTGYYYYFFQGLSKLYKLGKLQRIPKMLPVFIISGEQDPVGGYGDKVHRLFRMYQELHISDLQIKLYPGGRHEMLNEINREEVFSDVLNWINMRLH